MMNPFKIVWELIEFAVLALFVYGLALIIVIGLIAYTIINMKKGQPQVQYIYEKAVIEKEVQEVSKEKECKRISGCRVLEDGTIEY